MTPLTQEQVDHILNKYHKFVFMADNNGDGDVRMVLPVDDLKLILSCCVDKPPRYIQHIQYFDRDETIALSLGIAKKSSLWGAKTILLRDEHNGVNIYFHTQELIKLRDNINSLLRYLETKE